MWRRLGMQLQPPGSLSKGNGSLLWTERWKLSKGAEWLTSSGWALDYNKWGLTWPEAWETPTKTSKCISFRRHWEREREGVREKPAWSANLVYPRKGGVLNPGFLNLPSLLTEDPWTLKKLFALVSRTSFSYPQGELELSGKFTFVGHKVSVFILWYVIALKIMA